MLVTSTLPPATTIVPTTNVPTTNAPTTIAPTTAKPTATTKPGPVPSGKATVTIIDQNRFCLMLPPTPGSGTISDNEDRAISFCTSSSLVTGTKQMYSGFIQSAHFVSNSAKGYVQVTGRIKSSAAGLSSNDGGGQNDLRAPSGSMCAGYASYVQLLEPDAQIYCIRCCKNKADCPVNRSTYGCKSVLGGDYS
ncbi:hypothetical protein BGZ83_003574 [Gryganskiella cystojenkinii]|nr:hypothetical protein BGZ83_003574 [Gryganskiella cystojenkinii]